MAASSIECILYHGINFITISDDDAKGMMVCNGIIKKLYYTHQKITSKLYGIKEKNFRSVDLSKKYGDNACVMPGFVMSHTHLSTYAILTQSIKVSPMNLYFDADYQPPQTSSEVLERIKLNINDMTYILQSGKIESSKKSTDVPYIFAQGYDPILQSGKIIDRTDLDLISSEIPIYLMSASMHTIYVNTQVLINSGLVIRENSGLNRISCTGRVPDNAVEEVMCGALSEENLLLIASCIPKINAKQLESYLKSAISILKKQGITTVADATVQDTMFSFYRDVTLGMEKGIYPKIRIVGFPVYSPRSPFLLPSHGSIIQLDYKQFYENDYLKIGPMKIIGDGSVQGYTAFLVSPYFTPPFFDVPNPSEWRGQNNYPQIDLRIAFEEVIRSGMTLAVHGNGDADIEMILDALDTVNTKFDVYGKVRIEHSSLVTIGQIVRSRYLGVHLSFLNHHIYYYGDIFHDKVLGPKRSERIHPAFSAKEMGVSWDIHSDCPVSPPSPLFEIWTAVKRETSSGRVLGKEESIDVIDGLKACTLDSAKSLGISQNVGSLEVGKKADFIVLSENPIHSTDLRNVNILASYINGEL